MSSEKDKTLLFFFPIESVKSKANEIRKASTYSFSSEDVDKMVKQKEKFQRHPVNYAMHKARLIKVIFLNHFCVHRIIQDPFFCKILWNDKVNNQLLIFLEFSQLTSDDGGSQKRSVMSFSEKKNKIKLMKWFLKKIVF